MYHYEHNEQKKYKNKLISLSVQDLINLNFLV